MREPTVIRWCFGTS